jgi:predicted HicB family RNase H-like nuclease
MPIEARQRFSGERSFSIASIAGLSARLAMTAGSFGFSTNCWIERSSPPA